MSHLSVITQLMVLFCVTWVTEFTWTFGDYFDTMIFFFEKKKGIKLSRLSVIMRHDVILCDLGY